MKTIEEKNKIIADFMGLKESSIPNQYWSKQTKEGIGYGELLCLEYNSSWERLMPVVFKIVDDTTIYAQERQKVFNSINKDITTTYNAIINFIENSF